MRILRDWIQRRRLDAVARTAARRVSDRDVSLGIRYGDNTALRRQAAEFLMDARRRGAL